MFALVQTAVFEIYEVMLMIVILPFVAYSTRFLPIKERGSKRQSSNAMKLVVNFDNHCLNLYNCLLPHHTTSTKRIRTPGQHSPSCCTLKRYYKFN